MPTKGGDDEHFKNSFIGSTTINNARGAPSPGSVWRTGNAGLEKRARKKAYISLRLFKYVVPRSVYPPRRYNHVQPNYISTRARYVLCSSRVWRYGEDYVSLAAILQAERLTLAPSAPVVAGARKLVQGDR